MAGVGRSDEVSGSFFVNWEVQCTQELLLLVVCERPGQRRGKGRKGRGWAGHQPSGAGCPGSTPQQTPSAPWTAGPAGPGMDGAPTTLARGGPRAPAVGGHVREDSEQELAGVARLEGGGDDDVAALGLVRAQEDAARVDVDGAGGLVLQAVHAVLAVLLHLQTQGGAGHRATCHAQPTLCPLTTRKGTMEPTHVQFQNRQIYKEVD